MPDQTKPMTKKAAAEPANGAGRSPLTREAIVATAVELADREGVKGLTMRKLARALGFEVMSLYNHVANKNQLLDLIIDSVAGEVTTPDDSVEPMDAIRQMATALREALEQHPWAAELWLSQMPGPDRSRLMENLLRCLDRSDLPPDLAHHGFHAVTNHVVGYTIQYLGIAAMSEQEGLADDYIDSLPAAEYPFTIAHVHQHLDGDSAPSFDLVLDLILDGLVRMAAQD